MPLLKFDIIEGRSPEAIQQLLDISYEVVLETFQVPKGDRYQIVTQHQPHEMILEDTGLGFQRDPKQMVALTIVTRERTQKQKETFYQVLAERFEKECGIETKNLLVSMITNQDADWSFGFGRSQFLTGELS